jgi:RNA polymerase sigma factor (sigma-70 family)
MTGLTTSLTLLEALRDGRSQKAWGDFVQRYGPMLIGFAKRLGLSDADARDAVQETLVAVHQTFARMDGPFDRSKGKFKSWLRGIARNKVREIRRHGGQQERLSARLAVEADARSVDARDSEIEERFDLEWRRNQLAESLKLVARECDPAVFQAFELYAVYGQPPEKVAKLLGVSRNAVYISKSRVVQRLKAVLARLEEEEG